MDTCPSHNFPDGIIICSLLFSPLPQKLLCKISLSLSSRTLLYCARIHPVLDESVLSVCESTITLVFESQCASRWRFRRRSVRPRNRDLRLPLPVPRITWLSAFSEAVSSSRSSTVTYAPRALSMSFLARLVVYFVVVSCCFFFFLMNSSFVKCFDMLDW